MNNKYLFDEENKIVNNLFLINTFENIIGVDEVGRGSIAGPVVVAAVCILKYSDIFDEIDDSKKLTKIKREELYNKLINSNDIKYIIKIKDEKIIDKINILEATLLAMREAVEELQNKYGIKDTLTLVDGNAYIKEYNGNQKIVIKGDSKSLAIATASIIAKVYRDKLMDEYSEKYKEYDFSNNKGYGTKNHYLALEKYGECDIHRKTFLRKFYEKKDKRNF